MKTFIKSHPALVAAVLMFFTLTPLMALRDFTPANELRYLNIVDEMISEGNIFTLTNQGEPYADKPPLYFWLAALLRVILGQHSMYALSLLSFIPAAVIMVLMDRWLVSASGGSGRPGFMVRFASAMMLGTSALFVGTSVFLRMDMLMCMFIVMSLYSFYLLYTGKGNQRLHTFLFPVFVFLALFTKGPVGLLVPPVAVIATLAWDGRLRESGRYLGWRTWGIIALLCAVWFSGVWIEGGRPYLENLLFHQTVDRAVDAFHHKEPFWYYMVTIWYILAPYSLALVPVFICSFFRKRPEPASGRTDTGTFVRLSAAAVSVTFIMLSFFSSKLAIYLLPVFPFLVYVFSVSVQGFRWNGWLAASLALPSAVFILAGAAGAAVLAADCVPEVGGYTFIHSPWIYAALMSLAAGGAVSIYFLLRQKTWTTPVISMAASMLLCVLSASAVIPEANDYIGYGNLCRTASSLAHGDDAVETPSSYVTLGVYRPENMNVYLGTGIEDYGKDTDAYIEARIGPHILMVKTSLVENDEKLSRRLSGVSHEQCGGYSVYVMPGNPGPQS